MADRDVTETVVRLIAVELDVSEDRVRQAKSLRHDLKMDSVAAANLLFALEEEYAMEFDVDRVERFDTVADIAAVVARSVGDRSGPSPE